MNSRAITALELLGIAAAITFWVVVWAPGALATVSVGAFVAAWRAAQ